MRWRTVLLLATCLGACAGAGAGGAGGAAPARDLLTREEMSGYELMSVYDVIERQRPEWLRSRGRLTVRESEGMVLPVVYLDNSRYGTLESLRSLRTGDVQRIQHLSGPEATQRFGTGHAGGVIHVFTR